LPRFYFIEEIIEMDSTKEIVSVLREEDNIWNSKRFDPLDVALMLEEDITSQSFDRDNVDVKIVNYTNNSVALETYTESEEFLIFSDVYYPGWKAFIDDKETEVYKVNGILKGVLIPSGTHTTEFKFIPSKFWLLFTISISVLIASLTSISILAIKGKRSRNPNKKKHISKK
jgi:uncharacterized membrane protein YfhO